MTSPSTLLRAAKKAKTAKEAKRLRTLAANMRRDQRAAKAFQGSTIAELDGQKRKHRPMTGLGAEREKIIQRINRTIAQGKYPGIVAGLNPVYMQTDEAANDSNAARAASPDSMPLMQLTQQPGHGEIVGGYLAALAANIAKMARKKGGVDAIQAQLKRLEMEINNSAMSAANQRVQKTAQSANEQWRENIVTGFMARMAGLERMHRNGLPDTVIVDGVTLARVVDALHAAGYTSTGKR